MSQTDLFVLAGVIGLLLTVGLVGRKKFATTQAYFLAGRELRWWQIGISLFATNFSAAAIIGLTGAAYLTGIAIYNYEWVGIIAMVVFAMVLAGALRRSQVYTISQYLEERFGQTVKIAYSAFVIFLIIFIPTAKNSERIYIMFHARSCLIIRSQKRNFISILIMHYALFFMK